MIELLTNAEMGEADRLTIAGGVPGIDLMERAGAAVADGVMLRHPPASRVAVVAGSGNNGGDGFVAARLLAERGYAVEVLRVGGRARCAATRRSPRNAGPARPRRRRPSDWPAPTPSSMRCSAPASTGRWKATPRAIIEAMNAAACPIYAVDLPSGINGNTGAVMGAAVQRDRDGDVLPRRSPAICCCRGGCIAGASPSPTSAFRRACSTRIRPATFRNAPALWVEHFPRPRLDGHKYTRGHAVVLSGGIDSTGAARLAARGALRAGAGLVTIASPREALAVNAAASLAVMVRAVDDARELSEFLADTRRNVAVLGPGGGVGRADARAWCWRRSRLRPRWCSMPMR